MSSDGVRVSGRSAPESRSAVQMSGEPARDEKNAIVFPSGDQLAW